MIIVFMLLFISSGVIITPGRVFGFRFRLPDRGLPNKHRTVSSPLPLKVSVVIVETEAVISVFIHFPKRRIPIFSWRALLDRCYYDIVFTGFQRNPVAYAQGIN